MKTIKTPYGQTITIKGKTESKYGNITAVMVERMGDYDWQWYEVNLQLSPKEAVKAYLEDMDYKEELENIIPDDEFGGYMVKDLVRAYTFDIF